MSNSHTKKYNKGKIVFICLIALTLSLIFTLHNSDKDKIVRLVNKNQEFLNECIENKTYNKIYEIKAIKRITPYSLSDNELYIDFYCYGFGIAPSSIYYGFYYSSNNEPMGFQAYPVKLEQDGKGWKWKNPKGDNSYYTEKIADNWYYYKAGF